MKKLTALLLALVMVLAMNASALADTITEKQAYPAENTLSTSAISTIDFTVNYDVETGVDAPNTTFTYTIDKWDASAPNEAVLIAGTATTPEIRNGNGSASLPTPSVTLDEATNSGTVTINTGSYTQPGVYRYKLTQTDLTSAQTAAGVAAASQQELVLDIYVTKVGSDVVPTAVVLHKNAVAQESSTDEKVAGYENKYTPEPDTTTGTPDPGEDPTSYDVTITKAVDGNAASEAQEFAFVITVTGPTGTGIDFSGVTFDVVQNGTTGTDSAETAVTLSAAGTATLNVNMKHGSTVKIKGIPQNLKVNVTETPLDYEPSYGSTKVTGTTTGSSAATGDLFTQAGSSTIDFTNTRDNISPTGVVLRIAPYAIMLGAGVVLFIILKSRKNRAVEEA